MMEGFDIQKYLDIALRRKYLIIIPFLFCVLGGLGYFLKAPKIYEAETLILVQPQRVPEEFVRSIVSTSVEDRLRTITQQVTSRTNLEKIIQDFRLLNGHHARLDIDGMVGALRRRIKIDVKGGRRSASTFTIAFRGKDPEVVMKVTNALASNFIAENLKIREAQALGTSSFLADELETVKRRLLEKEMELKDYRERYMGGLPEQLQSNLAILARLQGQVDQLHDSLRDAENRKVLIQTQIADRSRSRQQVIVSSGTQQQETRNLQSLRNELASLESKYTSKHPDIIRLKEMIARLEQEEAQTTPKVGSDEAASALSGLDPTQRRQLQDIELQIVSLKDDINKAESQIKWYQKKVEDTPKREQELLSLKRDYENLKELYNSMLNRKLEAEIAVSMEKKQKGEQFRVIDPAKIPSYPVEPDMQKILLMTLALGLGLGCGLAYLMEMMDTSFKTPDEAETELKLPVLVSVPLYYTEQEVRIHKVREILKAGSVAVGFVVCAIGIVLATKGIGATINFAKTFLTNLGVL
jgi:polysaccharide chain length determinant protein (PEP-CTERM system associated)